MKLQLEHLAPYLPCKLILRRSNLKGQYHDFEMTPDKIISSLNSIPDDNWQPILRPLSDLLDENGKYFKEVQHRCLWKDCKYSEYSNFKIECDEVKMNTGAISFGGSYFVNGEYEFINFIYNDYQWLFENHFDIFGLIDNGLAIDINTIK